MHKLNTKELYELPATSVVVYRKRFRLVVYSRRPGDRALEKQHPAIPVSIGRLGFETPVGSYIVLDKEKPPTYTAPNEDWALEAGFTPGQKLPTDHPMNPLRGAWLRLTDDGIGIHGTDSFPLGQKASHGCIRVRPEDAVKLYELVELGSSVVVV